LGDPDQGWALSALLQPFKAHGCEGHSRQHVAGGIERKINVDLHARKCMRAKIAERNLKMPQRSKLLPRMHTKLL
jgi:hypothetical protein